MRHALFTLLILFASQAQAQVYRLYCTGQTTACYGSAVCVSQQRDGSYLFVTAKHVVTGTNRVFLDLPAGRTEGTLLGTSQKYDLAALRVRSRNRLPIYRIAPTDQTSGRFVAIGYANGGRVQSTPVSIREGNYVIYSRNGRETWTIPVQIKTNQRAFGGESGGAIVSTDGKLVGVISSTDSRSAYASGYTALCQLWGGFGWRVCPPQSNRPTAPIPEGDQPPFVPEEQPTEPEFDREIVRGPRGPQGPRGPKGDRGETGPAGPPGQSYDPAELEELKQRVSDLENKPSTVIVEPKAEPRDIVIKVVDENGKEVTVPVTVKPNQSKVTIPIVRD